VIVDNFYIEGVTVAELETKAPTTVDGHGPLAAPIAFQLVKPDTSQIAQLIQIRRGVQGGEQFVGNGGVEAAKP
jgi:hypothetical protein